MIGPGLLGGSLLKAVKKFLPGTEVRIWARRREALQAPQIQQFADFADSNLDSVVSGSDLVILAVPIQFMSDLAARFPQLDGAMVTDVGSTKESVVHRLNQVVSEKGGTFLGSHPMAGSEKTGMEHASAELFEGAAVVLTPTEENSEQEIDRLSTFWTSLGGDVSILAPAKHDETVAAISHLPHLVASALARSALLDPDNATARRMLVGGGFRDTTRIAGGDPAMWTEILLDNQVSVLSELGTLISELEQWKEALAALDRDQIRSLLSEAKKCREAL